MKLENLALLSRRSRLSVAVVILALIGAAAWSAGRFLQPAAPRHIVLASGLEDGLFHQYAKRYVEILKRFPPDLNRRDSQRVRSERIWVH